MLKSGYSTVLYVYLMMALAVLSSVSMGCEIYVLFYWVFLLSSPSANV